jgi:hypothetical protein
VSKEAKRQDCHQNEPHKYDRYNKAPIGHQIGGRKTPNSKFLSLTETWSSKERHPFHVDARDNDSILFSPATNTSIAMAEARQIKNL